ncbi:WD40 repeat-like protein [Corynespora cassiicola Philippines]|uniref:WD40 repeat-like protein n=1 Tax=Corynespora cassiicola Philippines TaxID=1448308 RepID=A0A2T2NQV9_CORCC|nr:WD40 repeat-like protein [Corynespora cassiicola Philippines]
MQPFSAEDDRLIIYLKEVLQLRWKDFERYFPGRKWTNVQVRYSQKLNKRDRTRDPPEYSLPPAILSAMDHQTSRPLPQPVLPHGPSPALFTSAHILEQDSLSERDSPSGNEYPVRRNRPRRDVPTHDYTWPRRHRISRAGTEVEDETVEATDADTPISSEPSVESVVIPEKAIPVENPPLDMELEQSDARLALSGVPTREGPEGRLPYLSCSQRSALQKRFSGWELDQLVSREWQGAVLHVDLSPAEMDIAESAISKVLGQPQLSDKLSRRRRFRMMLKDVSEPKLLKLGYELRYQLMSTRDTESIKAFLYDARKGKLRSAPMVERMGAARPKLDYSSAPKTSTASMVLQRELGLQSRRGWKSATHPVTYQLRNRLIDTLGPAYRYTGASSDVHTVAWSPDGQCFAAGAVCVTDAHSMQYNRPNNLLYGNVAYNTIHELREHYVERPKMESGPNSTQAMFESQDRKLYTTISSVAFSPNGKYMFSAGYDNHAVIWEAPRDGTQPRLIKALKHKAEVDMLAVSCTGKVATAAKKSSRHGSANAVKVISIGEDDPEQIERVSFTSQKAGERPDLNILPTALQFEPNHGRLLLAGFGANNREDRFDTNGDICLWDLHSQEQLYIHGSGRNVFDVAWNGDQRCRPWFAVGCVAGGNVNRGTRSVLRLYDGYGLDRYSMAMEIECKALDMNDVLFCPHDENLIAAGCTSGRAYVWDLRWPDTWLRELAHSSSLMPLDDYIDREITDTGVRFLSWGDNASRLYSGSSDGVVKVWDVIGSEEETFVKDLATLDSGIMAGAFSPDYSKLLIGEVDGSVNVLEVGRDDSYDAEKLKYIPYVEGPDEDAMEIPTTGVAIASDLVVSGEMVQIPFGGYPVRQAVQGPNYNGPYDNAIDAPFLREQALEMQLHLSKSPAPQCDIWACNDTVKVTSEEVGDSGRSEDRIPDELRKQWKLGGASSLPPGKSRCANCGRAARPMNSQEVDVAPLCERCSFACFRCGANNNVDPKTETLNCHHCQRVWSIGTLGFECVRETLDPTNFSDVPSLRQYAKKVSRTKLGEDNASFGDEMNALTDYFHSLATDRPDSPPL